MGGPRAGTILGGYLSGYANQLYLVAAMLCVGLLFGVLAVGTLSVGDKLSLASYLKNFLNLEAARPSLHGVFQPALASNLKTLGLLYLLGVSVAGMPFVLLLVFFRGFVLGFSFAFLWETLHGQGILVGVVAIGLENVFLLPALIIVAGAALGFSWQLILPRRRPPSNAALQGFAAFTGLVLAMSLVVIVGTAIEAYVVPFLLHWLAG